MKRDDAVSAIVLGGLHCQHPLIWERGDSLGSKEPHPEHSCRSSRSPPLNMTIEANRFRALDITTRLGWLYNTRICSQHVLLAML
jgi:hypothetical protein